MYFLAKNDDEGLFTVPLIWYNNDNKFEREVIIMLLERITYADDFPINIQIAQLTEDPLHYHLDIEIIYVLRGEILLKNGYCHYHLQKGDIFTNSGHEVHGMTALTEDNVVAIIQINSHFFSQYFPNLSKACYRTYSRKAEDARHDILRDMLLRTLLKYVLRSFNYKSECVYLMGDIIKHLDKYFNLFAFDKDMVVGFDRGNPVATERISHICQYIYQYYAENITLEDLSNMEHLSPFYLSHLIKDYTGMNFREFLCFARVEWSEILLLGSDKKVSQIAREVGFSTTAYYRKYFEKWFSATPEEHRRHYLPKIKSDLHPAAYLYLPANRAIEIVKDAQSSYNLKKDSSTVVENLHLDLTVATNAKALRRMDPHLTVRVTAEDYRILGIHLLPALHVLAPEKVALLRRKDDDPEEFRALSRLLRGQAFAVEKRTEFPEESIVAANDSIAAATHLLHRYFDSGDNTIECALRDSGDGSQILQGKPGLLTASGGRKPTFCICQALSQIKGDLICHSSNCWVVRMQPEVFAVLVCHGTDAMDSLLSRPADAQEVKNAIRDFKDEVSIGIQMDLKPGSYTVVKYSLNKEENIFAHMAAMNFPEELPAAIGRDLSDAPAVEAYTEDVCAVFQTTFSFKGAGIQAAVIQARKGLR